MRLLQLCCLALAAACAEAFRAGGVLGPRGRQTLLHSAAARKPKTSGGHGEGFRFLPLIRTNSDEHYPRIMQIAGVFPDLTPEDLLAPSSTPSAPQGSWSYDFSDLSGPQLGKVAIPGSSVVTDSIDPVVMLTTNTALNIAVVVDVEMLVVVDRGDKVFNSDSFFVFRTPENTLKVQWSDSVPQGWSIMGKIVACTVPFVSEMRSPASGFAESDGE